MDTNRLPPMHPGEVLREEFLEPLGMTAYALARALHVPRPRIERIVREENPITADTALRLARYFGMSPEFWTRLQDLHDLRMTEQTIAADLRSIEPRREREPAQAEAPPRRLPSAVGRDDNSSRYRKDLEDESGPG